ncbi:hypothetical protein N871_01200 [Helicobacter pylori X47-2AL]|uniref:Uncharacterized protein n=1 Tax=Helicobacter pylori X47-2AL TaxID=1386083 RepID=V6LBR6_HELPX|nr:hypothetical protein N871_01200 [Helicobacter pylori X47-2AL]
MFSNMNYPLFNGVNRRVLKKARNLGASKRFKIGL